MLKEELYKVIHLPIFVKHGSLEAAEESQEEAIQSLTALFERMCLEVIGEDLNPNLDQYRGIQNNLRDHQREALKHLIEGYK